MDKKSEVNYSVWNVRLGNLVLVFDEFGIGVDGWFRGGKLVRILGERGGGLI